MTNEQLSKMTRDLTELLRPYAEQAAQREVQAVLARLLGTPDEIRGQVYAAIQQQVQEIANKHVYVELRFKP